MEDANSSNDKAIDNKKGNKKKRKAVKSTGFIANLTEQSALPPHWNLAKFTGYINQPLIKYQHGKITKALVHPIAATHD